MKNNEYLNLSILALIIISAIFLRFYNYNLQDFWWDELVAFLNVDPSLSLKETFLRAHSFTIGTNLSYDYAENANFYFYVYKLYDFYVYLKWIQKMNLHSLIAIITPHLSQRI